MLQLDDDRLAPRGDCGAVQAIKALVALALALEAVARAGAVVWAALDVACLAMPTSLAQAFAMEAQPTLIAVAGAERHVAEAAYPSGLAGAATGFLAGPMATAVCFALRGHMGKRRLLKQRCRCVAPSQVGAREQLCGCAADG